MNEKQIASKAIEEALILADKLALDIAKGRVEGYDRDGYDLWWEPPWNFFPDECRYLELMGEIVQNPENSNLFAWKDVKEEWESENE
jgi:hypothetical protein